MQIYRLIKRASSVRKVGFPSFFFILAPVLFFLLILHFPLFALAESLMFMDEAGNIHFVQRLDEVPSRYREQIVPTTPFPGNEKDYKRYISGIEKEKKKVKREKERQEKKIAREEKRKERKEKKNKGKKKGEEKLSENTPATKGATAKEGIRSSRNEAEDSWE